MVDGTLDIFCSIVAFEATNDTLVVGLNMCSEIRCKVLYMNVSEIVRNNMPREVVLEK